MPITRREFSLGLGAVGAMFPQAATQDNGPWSGPAEVAKAYLAVPKPTWPHPALDVTKEMAEVEAGVTAVERKHAGQVRFSAPALLRTAQDAEQFVKGLSAGVDAVLLIDLTSGTSPMLQVLRNISAPTLLFSRPYSGWSYADVAQWAQSGKKADLVVSSEFGELGLYLRIFRAIRHLGRSKVLVVNSNGRNPAAEGFSRQFGTAIEFATYQQLRSAFEAVPAARAEKSAAEFTRAALRVVEPSPAEITDACRFHFGVMELLRQAGANAITIDCLGGFRRGDLPAYPCVAWTKLNDAGYYGVCEADLHSTMTQILLTPFTNQPGFVSDPVFDTARNEVIHAHCVSATALRGLGGPPSPYVIRSHMEDNKGVSLQVNVPTGGTVTVGKFLDPATFAVSTGAVIENVDSVRGCRTKFRTRVADARKMVENFNGGLHRVVFWGDYAQPIGRMGRLLGFRVIQEG